ncbi:MAG: hypothetical protein ABI399_05660, partial [Bauldia sp.]
MVSTEHNRSDSVVAFCTDRAMFLPAILAAEGAARFAPASDVVVFVERGAMPDGFRRWHRQRGGRFAVIEVDLSAWIPDRIRFSSRFPKASGFRLM